MVQVPPPFKDSKREGFVSNKEGNLQI